MVYLDTQKLSEKNASPVKSVGINSKKTTVPSFQCANFNQRL